VQIGRLAPLSTDSGLPFTVRVSPSTVSVSHLFQVHLSGGLSGVAPGPMVLYVDAQVHGTWHTEYWLTGSLSSNGPFQSGPVLGADPAPPPGTPVVVEGSEHRAYFTASLPPGNYRACRLTYDRQSGKTDYVCTPLNVVDAAGSTDFSP